MDAANKLAGFNLCMRDILDAKKKRVGMAIGQCIPGWICVVKLVENSCQYGIPRLGTKHRFDELRVGIVVFIVALRTVNGAQYVAHSRQPLIRLQGKRKLHERASMEIAALEERKR